MAQTFDAGFSETGQQDSGLELSLSRALRYCSCFVVFSITMLWLFWQPWSFSPYKLNIDTTIQLLGSIAQVFLAFFIAIVATMWGIVDSYKRKMSYHQNQMESRGIQSTDENEDIAKHFNLISWEAEQILNLNSNLENLRQSTSFRLLPGVAQIENQKAVTSNILFYRGLHSWLQQQQFRVSKSDEEDRKKAEGICAELLDVYLAVWHRNEKKKLQDHKLSAEFRLHFTFGFAMAELGLVLCFLGDPLLGRTLAFLPGLTPPKELIPSGVLGLYIVFILIIGTMSALALVYKFYEIYSLPRDPEF